MFYKRERFCKTVYDSMVYIVFYLCITFRFTEYDNML